MEIKEAQNMKKVLEDLIARSITEHVDYFMRETGLRVVDVEMAKYDSFVYAEKLDDKTPHSITVDVKAEVDFGACVKNYRLI